MQVLFTSCLTCLKRGFGDLDGFKENTIEMLVFINVSESVLQPLSALIQRWRRASKQRLFIIG